MNDRTHTDLLDAVADSREEAYAVRRILSEHWSEPEPGVYVAGGLTERDLDAHERFKRAPFAIGAANHAHRHSRSCSRCESGLTHCTTPEACERAATQDDDAIGTFRGLVNSLPFAVLAWLAVAVAIATVLSIWPN